MRARTDEMPPPLDERPKADSFQIDDLMRDIAKGAVRIPTFQRELNWGPEDKRALFDSIYRGYPVGTLLFWKRAAPAARVVLGAYEMDALERAKAYWVVDGQQRLTTLAETLLREPSGEEPRLVFDLGSQQFVYETRRSKTNAARRRVPLSVVLDASDLGEWVAEGELSRDERRLAYDLGKRIREYQVPGYVVDAVQENVLREIFHRMNATGKRLEETDVFHALYGSLSPRRTNGAVRRLRPPSNLRDVVEHMSALGFGAIAERDALNALKAVNDLAIDRDISETLSKDAARAAIAATDRALAMAIGFLQSEAGIPHVDLLPYALPLAVLSKFFHLFPEAHTRNRILLRRWLWRASIREQLTGAIVGVRKHVESVRARQEDESVQRLLRLAGKEPNPQGQVSDPFNFRHARSKLQCAALLTLNPRHLVSGEPLDVRAMLEVDLGDALPAIFPGPKKVKGARGLANRLLHPHAPSSELRRAILGASDDVLASHSISAQARAALRKEDDERFLTIRREDIERHVARVFERRAEWLQDDSPPLDSLVTNGDEDE